MSHLVRIEPVAWWWACPLARTGLIWWGLSEPKPLGLTHPWVLWGCQEADPRGWVAGGLAQKAGVPWVVTADSSLLSPCSRMSMGQYLFSAFRNAILGSFGGFQGAGASPPAPGSLGPCSISIHPRCGTGMGWQLESWCRAGGSTLLFPGAQSVKLEPNCMAAARWGHWSMPPALPGWGGPNQPCLPSPAEVT